MVRILPLFSLINNPINQSGLVIRNVDDPDRRDQNIHRAPPGAEQGMPADDKILHALEIPLAVQFESATEYHTGRLRFQEPLMSCL